jgi:hypothetical protein
LDYHKIFAPIMKWGTLWLIASIVTHKDWPILHLNVQTTFLNGFLFEEVHMEQLVRFVELGAKHKVCLFKCALYTLNQSPHACIVVSFNSYDDKISSKVLRITIFTTMFNNLTMSYCNCMSMIYYWLAINPC